MKEDKVDRNLIWKRIDEIRQNDTDSEKLKPLLDDWKKDFGPEYNDLVNEVFTKRVQHYAAIWAKENGIATAEDIVRHMWEGWTEGEFTIERTEKGIQIHCTKCPHADTYLAIGEKELGLQLKCSEDPPIIAGVGPHILFKRTKFLINGDDCCDHFYSNKQKE